MCMPWFNKDAEFKIMISNSPLGCATVGRIWVKDHSGEFRLFYTSMFTGEDHCRLRIELAIDEFLSGRNMIEYKEEIKNVAGIIKRRAGKKNKNGSWQDARDTRK